MKITTKLILSLISIIVGITVFEKYTTTQDTMEQYITEYKHFQAQSVEALHMVDSLKTIIVIKENEATIAVSAANKYSREVKVVQGQIIYLKSTQDSLRHSITDSTELARRIIPALDTIIAKQDTVITHQSSEIGNLRFALEKKDTVISLLTFSRDSLHQVILNIPKAPSNPNKMFGITLPSRTVSFATGILLGLFTSIAIKQ